MIIFIALFLLSFLSGCSWFNPSEQDETITDLLITPTEHPIDTAPSLEEPSQEISEQPEEHPVAPTIEPIIELHKPETSPLPEQNLQTHNVEPIKPVVIQKEKKHRRRRKRRQDRHTQQSTPKTIIELAEKPSEEIALQQISPSTDDTSFASPKTLQTAEKRQIMIHNVIDKPMVTVKHWTGKYVPTLLSITVNGNKKELVQNKQVVSFKNFPADVTNNTLTIDFKYEFMNGRRKGSSTTTYHVDPEAQALDMSFTWDNAWHVEFDKAKPIVTHEH